MRMGCKCTHLHFPFGCHTIHTHTQSHSKWIRMRNFRIEIRHQHSICREKEEKCVNSALYAAAVVMAKYALCALCTQKMCGLKTDRISKIRYKFVCRVLFHLSGLKNACLLLLLRSEQSIHALMTTRAWSG